MIAVDGTLKRRLGVWLLATVGVLGAFLLVEAYTSAQRAANRAYDSQLEAAGLTVAEAIQWQDGQPIVEMPAAAFQILATDQQERVFYAILDAAGREVTGNLDGAVTPAWQRAAKAGPVWMTVSYHGTSIRLHGRELTSAGWESLDPVQIWVGHTLSGREALAGDLFERTLTRFLAMVLVAALLMLLAIRTALAPVRRLRQSLRQRDADDVRPLHAQVPGELYDMAETLNALFARQREGRDALLRFTADASHQLRTPLAGLQSTSELALQSEQPDEWRHALETVHASAARTSRLAGQLLSLARLRHASEGTRDTLDLSAVLRDTLMEWAERDAAQHHDLGLAPLPAEPVRIQGESWSLREMIGNLIDNALRYTPPGSEITLELERHPGSVTLSIEDSGPGVSDELLGRLHQPFERGGRQDTQGSGLGLAIVDSIARRHDAALEARNTPGHGLWVGVHFPLSAETN
ncbi:sensor histidine kinase [Modicisalibacter tunisiensis]|uniref:histidine kinase n=1 Tax=Modicisalibacter tunisiensis TaxID=390637 RepID=A0ABS7X4Y7_9GAMM|nr:sensor histidine kinase [Modicisalibacter tunisiensis]MBZ9537486.1 sensor histidine kinase [Modicisalibacter tunisiensis]MBZ9569092.1 sensor histidine kinase [Modicisalibacter tunisiensis]